MSSRRLQDMSSRRPQRNNFSSSKTCWRRLQDALEDVKLLRWRRVEDVFKTCLDEDVFKTSWRPKNICWVKFTAIVISEDNKVGYQCQSIALVGGLCYIEPIYYYWITGYDYARTDQLLRLVNFHLAIEQCSCEKVIWLVAKESVKVLTFAIILSPYISDWFNLIP